MKTEIISDYTFDKVARTVTLTNFALISLERLISITDLTNRRMIYFHKLPNLGAASFLTNVVTLEYDTNQDGFNNSDKLLIEYAAYNFQDTVVDSAARIADGVSGIIENIGGKGAMFIVNTTLMTGSAGPTMVIKLQAYDKAANVWIDIPGAATPAIVGVGVTLLTVYPGIAEVANSKVSSPIPKRYRLWWTITGTLPSFTFSVSANYIS